MPKSIAEAAAIVLRESLAQDGDATRALLFHRVACQKTLGDHPTIPCRVEHGAVTISTLGLINGIIGSIEPGAAVWAEIDDDSGAVVGFHAGTIHDGEADQKG